MLDICLKIQKTEVLIMDEYNRKRGIKYLNKEEEYSLYILIEGNEFL